MPIELDLKRDARPKTPTGKSEKSDEVLSEPPPFSALAHLNVDNIEFVVALCPGRHNPDKPRKKPGPRGPDGKPIKKPQPCKHNPCNIRTGMIDAHLEKTHKMKARMQEIAGQLEGVKEERLEAEQELETQQQYMAQAETKASCIMSVEYCHQTSANSFVCTPRSV